MTEIWKAVPGFEGAYEVSNLGRVRSLDRHVSIAGRWGPETRFYRGRVLRQTNGGTHKYQTVTLASGGTLSTWTVHILVLAAFVGPCPPGEEGRHLDCDPLNNSADNLVYGSRKANREDSRAAGTLAIGERIAQHKLTAADVQAIRASDLPARKLTALYPVGEMQIRRVRDRENWKHV